MKKLFLFATFLIVAVSMYAQTGAVIDFKDKSHDFGTIAEENGSVTCEFIFTNKGDAPLVISRVSASCGCTTPDWTKEPIAPGKTGFIKATYSAKGRPGQFVKQITVYSNAKDGNVTLTIKGNVTPKTASISESFPYSIGDLKLKNINLPFYDVSNKMTKTDKIGIYNSGKAPLSVHFSRVPSHLVVETSPAVLNAGAQGEIIITYKGNAIKDWGARTDDVFLLLNNESRIANDRKISVSANIVEDFSTLTPEQRAQAAHIEVSSLNVDFGKIVPGEKKNQVITIKNTGKSTLHIHKVACDASYLQVKIDRSSIAPGKSAKLDIALLSGKLRSGLNERISVISNDPAHSNMVVRVLGTR